MGVIDSVPTTSLTFLFGITTFGIADELLAEETLGLEAAPVEVEVLISIILIEWEMNGYPTSLWHSYGERVSKGGLLAFYLFIMREPSERQSCDCFYVFWTFGFSGTMYNTTYDRPNAMRSADG